MLRGKVDIKFDINIYIFYNEKGTSIFKIKLFDRQTLVTLQSLWVTSNFYDTVIIYLFVVKIVKIN